MYYIRFWVVALICGPLFLLAGGNQLKIYHENPKPIEMSIDEYVRTRPQGKWVRLTNCRVAYPGAVYSESTRSGRGTRLTGVSVPVFAGGNFSQPVSVVLGVADARAKEVLANGVAYGVRVETIEGLVRSGPFYTGLSKELQNVAEWKVSPVHVIIDEGRKPQLGSSLGIMGVGVALLGYVAMSLRSSVNDASATSGRD